MACQLTRCVTIGHIALIGVAGRLDLELDVDRLPHQYAAIRWAHAAVSAIQGPRGRERGAQVAGFGLDHPRVSTANVTGPVVSRMRESRSPCATFNLLPNDEAMGLALAAIATALAPNGTAIIPLFVPEPVNPETIGVPRRQEPSDGWLSVQVLTADRDESTRTRTVTLRYARMQ